MVTAVVTFTLELLTPPDAWTGYCLARVHYKVGEKHGRHSEREVLFVLSEHQKLNELASWRSRYKRRRYRGCRAACWFCGSPGLLPAPGSSGHLYSNPRINSSKSTSGSFSSVDGPSRHLDRARVWGGLCESFRGVLCRSPEWLEIIIDWSCLLFLKNSDVEAALLILILSATMGECVVNA